MINKDIDEITAVEMAQSFLKQHKRLHDGVVSVNKMSVGCAILIGDNLCKRNGDSNQASWLIRFRKIIRQGEIVHPETICVAVGIDSGDVNYMMQM